jgi:heparan sulfate 2-O-sulfotransferase HS2ST1
MYYAAFCREPGNKWALEMAKENVLRHYLVVGVTEELHDFVAVLEAVLPRFFTGAVKLFEQGMYHLLSIMKNNSS